MHKPANKEQIERQGYYEIKATVARQPVSLKSVGLPYTTSTLLTHLRVTADDHHRFARQDTSIVWERFPAAVDVLTLHGMKDAVVAP